MSKKIIILGTGGNSIDILDAINAINLSRGGAVYDCVGFLDDNEQRRATLIQALPVLGPLNAASRYPGHFFVNGIGSPGNFWNKKDIIGRTGLADERFETIIHPSASVSAWAQLGPGTVVFQNVTITSNVKVGRHVAVLPNSVISHDNHIGDYTCLAGGVCLSGGVTVGHSSYLGTHSCIRGNVRIGNYSMIGMGSVVLGDVGDNQVVAGNPASFLRHTMPVQANP